MSESDESIFHIEEIKNIVEQQKHYTAKRTINGTPKEFIIDTGSPVTIMPLDEQIIKKTEIQKITNRYQDVNKNEVKFRGKVPVNIAYEKKQSKNGITNYRKSGHSTLTGDELDEKIQADNR